MERAASSLHEEDAAQMLGSGGGGGAAALVAPGAGAELVVHALVERAAVRDGDHVAAAHAGDHLVLPRDVAVRVVDEDLVEVLAAVVLPREHRRGRHALGLILAG